MGVPNEQPTRQPLQPEAAVDERLTLEDRGDVPMHLEVLLGGALLSVRQILAMKEGTVVPLRKMAGEMSDVYVNGMSLARGEIVVIGDNLSVRIAEITGASPDNPVDGG